ncbi:MAG: hypothetical protein ACJ8F3_08250 [Xanthobacteraceae bacterium]
MWRRKPHKDGAAAFTKPAGAQPLKEALRRARVDQAERTSAVLDLHDAEVARLEALDEALDPIFEEIPADVDLFDRGISGGATPRLWIDAVAHVAMGRDKRRYRFFQDTRYGRKALAESENISDMVHAVTTYLAQRMIERERALASGSLPVLRGLKHELRAQRRQRQGRALMAFLFGLVLGFATLVAAVMLFGPRI